MTNHNKTIAFVVNTAWNIFNYRQDLIELLLSQGFQIIVYIPKEDYPPQYINPACKIVYLKSLSRKGKNPLIDIVFTIELWLNFRRTKPDLVLLYTPKPNIYGSMAANWAGVKSIATITGLGYTFTMKSMAAWVIKKLYKIALKNADLIVFQNPDDQELFIKNNWVDRSKAKILNGSGINVEKFYPHKKSKLHKQFNFLFIGRLLKDKGIIELLDAFEILSKNHDQITLTLVGQIDNYNPASFKQKEIDNRIENNPKIDHVNGSVDVRSHIKHADIVVLPSYREGMPKTILESLSMGKPIIVSDVPGCRETVIPGKITNGLLCRKKDSISLAKQMEKMILFTEEERLQMGQLSRKLAVEKFDQKIINQEYLSLINQLT